MPRFHNLLAIILFFSFSAVAADSANKKNLETIVTSGEDLFLKAKKIIAEIRSQSDCDTREFLNLLIMTKENCENFDNPNIQALKQKRAQWFATKKEILTEIFQLWLAETTSRKQQIIPSIQDFLDDQDGSFERLETELRNATEEELVLWKKHL